MFEGKSIRELSPVRIGGRANYFMEAFTVQQVKEAMGWARDNNKKVKIFSCASNILFADKIFDEFFLKVSIDFFSREGNSVLMGAGRKVSSVMGDLLASGLSGLEFLAGIPGSIGGCVKNNSSTHWGNIADVLDFIKVVDSEGNEHVLQGTDIRFDYRGTDISPDVVITAVGFRLSSSSPEKVKEKIKEVLGHRYRTQPLGKRSLGCVFKNPGSTMSSGELIERAGLKGMSEGKVSVSLVHANFFEVEDGALFNDFYNLFNNVKKIVKERFKVDLEPEIQIWKD